MAIQQDPNTILDGAQDPIVQQTEIALALANGSIYQYQTTKDIYVTSVRQQFSTTNVTNVTNEAMGGNGEIQFYQDGKFAADKDFKYDSTTDTLMLAGLSTANLRLSGPSNVSIGGGAPGMVLSTNGAGNLTWINQQVATTMDAANVTFTPANNVVSSNVQGAIAELGAKKLSLTGGTMTGQLILSGPPTTALAAVTKSYVDSAITNGLSGSPAFANSAGNITVAAQPNITSVGTLTSLDVSGLITGDGGGLSNINGANITGTVAFAGTANSVAGANVTGTVASATVAASANSVDGANVTGTVASATIAASANSVAGANVTGAVAFATTANSVAGANVTGAVGFATVANSVAGANVTGAVTFATTANSVAGGNVTGTVASATVAASANSVAGANVTGTVASATVAASANSVAGANVTGQVSFAMVANSVAGANVTGTVASATVAASANSVDGANVTGTVASATVAATANSVAGANVTGEVAFAATANTVAGANVTGAVGFATVANSVSGANVFGAVTFATTANSVAGGNVTGQVANALVAGTVYTAAQPNITSVGTLTSLAVTGNTAAGNFTTAGNVVATGNVQADTAFVGNALTTRTGPLTLTATGSSNLTLAVGTGNIDLSTPTYITNLKDPVSAQDAATKNYVDALTQGLKPKAAAECATATNIVLAPAPATIDGYTLVTGDRVLVKAQTATAENGIYTFDGTNLVRATDADSAGELVDGTFIFVTGGSTFAASGFVQTAAVTTLGTDPVTFVQFSTGGTYTAGSGITLTGSQFSVSTTGVTTGSYGNATHVPSFTVDAKGQLTAAGTNAVIGNAETLAGTTLNSTVVNSSLTSVGTLTSLAVTGALTAASFTGAHLGEAGNLSNIQGANVSGNVTSAVTANFANFAGNVTVAAQPNITSVGTLTSLALASGAEINSFGEIKSGPASIPGTTAFEVSTAGAGSTTIEGVLTVINSSLPGTLLSVNTVTGKVDITGDLIVNGLTDLGSNTDVYISGGAAGQVLSTDGMGNLSWTTPAAGSSVITVDYASTVNIPGGVEYTQTFSIDGSSLSSGDRVLIKNQTSKNENGIWIVQSNFWMVRATDADDTAELQKGTLVYVKNGTSNAGKSFIQTNLLLSPIGMEDISFSPFAGSSGSYTAQLNGGLALSGTAFSIDASSASPGTFLQYIGGGFSWGIPVSSRNYTYLSDSGSGVDVSVAMMGNDGIGLYTGNGSVTMKLGIPPGYGVPISTLFNYTVYITASGGALNLTWDNGDGSSTGSNNPIVWENGTPTTVASGTNLVIDFISFDGGRTWRGLIQDVPLAGGTNGQVLTSNGSGGLSWTTPVSGGTTLPLANGTSNINIPTAGGNINFSTNGTANVLAVGTAAITGNAGTTTIGDSYTTGRAAFGPTISSVALANAVISAGKQVDDFIQIGLSNGSNTANASADFIAYNDNGSYIDIGVASNAFSNTSFTITNPSESYLFASTPTGSTSSGNLVIATDSKGTTNSIEFYIGGFAGSKSGSSRKLLISSTGIRVSNAYTSGTSSLALSTGAVDCSLSNFFVKSIGSAQTISFTNVPASGTCYSCTVKITINAGGSIAFPAAVKWPSSTTPTFTTGKTHMVMMVTVDGGTSWNATAITDY